MMMTNVLMNFVCNVSYSLIIAMCSIFLFSVLYLEYFTIEASAITPNSDIKSETPIKHVIVISQGVRSFDNYFGAFPGANGIPKNLTLPLYPVPPPSIKFTLAAWFNTNNTLPSKGFIINKGGFGRDTPGQNMNYGIWMNPNGGITGGFETKNGTNYFVGSDGRYNDGRWHYVVVTYDGNSRLTLYIDGNQTASNSTKGAIPDTSGTKPIIIGANSFNQENFFTGFIDEVRIWNRTLGYQEILDGYKNNEFSTKAPFVYLSFEDGKNNAVHGGDKRLQLKGLYLNGSSFQNVNLILSKHVTYVGPFHLEETKTDKPYYSSNGYKISYNNGQMDGFLLPQTFSGNDPRLVLGYYNDVELPYYWNFASEFVLADNFFAPTMNSGLSNGLYLVGGFGGYQKNISLNGMSNINKTIFNELEQSGLSWKIYTEDYAQVLNQSNNDKKKGVTNILTVIPGFLDNKTLNSNIVNLYEYFRDLNSDEFPSVAYVVAPIYDESSPRDPSLGQEFVAALVSALMNSKHWNDSLFIITYRESGGWYDHVPPPVVNGQLYGFRVPTLIISPFSKKGYVDNTLYDPTSVLKFIEYNYGLSPLTERDAKANNILNAFDFTKPPRKPLFLEEISRGRLIVKSNDVSGVNAVYFFSILAPVVVTVLWYYKKQKEIKKLKTSYDGV